jgi:hypothetical protein
MNPPKKSATTYCNVSTQQSVLGIQPNHFLPERARRSQRKEEMISLVFCDLHVETCCQALAAKGRAVVQGIEMLDSQFIPLRSLRPLRLRPAG